MSTSSADIAASIENTCQDIAVAMATWQIAPVGMRVRTDLLVAVDQLHERLGHLLAALARKHREEK